MIICKLRQKSHILITGRLCWIRKGRKKKCRGTHGWEDINTLQKQHLQLPGARREGRLSVFTCFSSFLVYLCTHTHTNVEVSGQLVGVGPFRPLCRFQDLNSGQQAGQQGILLAEPFCWPYACSPPLIYYTFQIICHDMLI